MRASVLLAFLSLSELAAAGDVAFKRHTDRVDVLIDGRHVTSFHFGNKWDKPFLHPLRTSNGVTVSRAFPVEPGGTDATDHYWQRGIWWAHGDVNGVDFWRELGREKTGRMVSRSGPKLGAKELTAAMDMLTPPGKSLGTVHLTYAFATDTIDAAIIVLADGGQTLVLGDTEECCFGLRFRDEFRQDRGATLVNSNGLKDTENIWGKRAQWIDYSSEVNGVKAGVAVFDHPSNPRHPTWWHARGYAFASANATGERNFTSDKSKDGRLTIPAGGKIEFRYRVVMHSGSAAEAGIPRLYNAWAGGRK
jgi:hypothetical protein